MIVRIAVAIFLIGILFGILTTQTSNIIPKEEPLYLTKQKMLKLHKALMMFKLAKKRFPTKVEGLEILDKHGYIHNIEPDAWGNPFTYEVKKQGCKIISFGADAKIGGFGYNKDIVFELK